MSKWESGENRFARENEKLICFKENGKVIGIGGINEESYLRKILIIIYKEWGGAEPPGQRPSHNKKMVLR